jgi:hypothetical protein
MAMGKRVVIIASGETERRALPHLLRHPHAAGIEVVEVAVPPGSRNLDVEMAARLIQARSWYWKQRQQTIDKFVVLVDTDNKNPQEVLQPFRNQLPQRVGTAVTASLQFAYAQQHLEAWYFADEQGLRNALRRDLGQVDPSMPDQINNPKHHLSNLLKSVSPGRQYTAPESEEIARQLDPQIIAGRSPSFQSFVDAVRNGAPAA